MNAEIARLKQDLKIIEEAVGCEPEFNRGQVWRSIGLGMTGLAMMLLGIFANEVPVRPWGALMILVLCFRLPSYFITRIACPDTPRVASTADHDLNNPGLLSLLTVLFLVGFSFWLHSLAVPPMVVAGLMCFLIGAVAAVWTWRRPWRRFALAFASAFMVLGMALPFLHDDLQTIPLMMGGAFAIGNFAGALILHRQLQDFHAHGKAAD